MKNKKWVEINLEEKYVIFEDNPKKKISIKDGKIILDMSRKRLKVQVELLEIE